jgi:hypothetical protein
MDSDIDVELLDGLRKPTKEEEEVLNAILYKTMLVKLHILKNGRKTPIANGYRPDWRSLRKPELNGGQITLLDDIRVLAPGETGKAYLQPILPELWKVEIGDILLGCEGFTITAQAEILSFGAIEMEDQNE